jgi:hypothetical protein
VKAAYMTHWFKLFIVSLFLFACSKTVDLSPQGSIQWHAQSEFSEIIKAVNLKDGSTAVIGAAEGSPALIVFGDDLRPKFYKVYKEFSKGRINDLIELRSGGFAAVGFTNTDTNGQATLATTALALLLDANGEISKSFLIDKGEYDHFGTLIQRSDGSLQLFGGSSGQLYSSVIIDSKITDHWPIPTTGLTQYVSTAIQNKEGKTLFFTQVTTRLPSGGVAISRLSWRTYSWDGNNKTLVELYNSANHNYLINLPLLSGNSLKISRIEAILSEDSMNAVYATCFENTNRLRSNSVYLVETSLDASLKWEEIIEVPEEYFLMESFTRYRDGFLIVGSVGDYSKFRKYYIMSVDFKGNIHWTKSFGKEEIVQTCLSAKVDNSRIRILGNAFDEQGNSTFTSFDLNFDGEFIK